MTKIYQVGKVSSPEGAFYVVDCGIHEGNLYYEVYFKRTGRDPEHYLYNGYSTAKEACMAVDFLVRKWIL